MSSASALDRLEQARQQPWVARLIQHAPSWTAYALVALIAWQVSRLLWGMFPSREDAVIEPPAAASQPAEALDASAGQVDVSGIVSAHVFGEADPDDATQATTVVDTEVSRETDLPLELKGTLAADSDDNAIAIIADGREEKVYMLGDTIRSGVTLHAVERERVILSRGGVLESLNLPKVEQTASTAPTRRAQPTIRRAANTPSVSQVLTNNASQLTQVISPRPYYVGGQQRGYRLYPGSNRQAFAKLGLRPGDVVTAINGTPLNNPTQGARIFSSLGDAQSITVTLERGGQEQTMTLDTTSLDLDDQDDQ